MLYAVCCMLYAVWCMLYGVCCMLCRVVERRRPTRCNVRTEIAKTNDAEIAMMKRRA
jgi:transcriptional regulatory protein LevR